MITLALMERLFPTKGLNPKKYNLVRERAKLVETLNLILPKYKINNYKRVCAFLGNCGIETDYFRTTEEYASGEDYEGRADLGNTQKGNGRRFKGRDLTQTTGRFNYTRVNNTVGAKLGIDFLKHPERLAEVEIAVESACILGDDHNLNEYADRGAFEQLSGIVNRGDKNKTPLQWAKRSALYTQCKKTLPLNFSFALPPDAAATNQLTNAANSPVDVINPVLASPSADQSGAAGSDFLTNAFDKNISSDEVKALARDNAPSLWKSVARPLAWLFAALEAGNVYAWLGLAVFVFFVAVELYLHRAKIFTLWDKLKAKLTS